MRNIAASALIFLAACSSTRSDRPADIAQPAIQVRQAGPIFLSQGTTPVTIDVEVTNRANVPLTIREVEIGSSDSQQYSISPARRLVNETVAPNESRTVQLSTTAVARTTQAVGQSLVIRAFVRLEANGKSFREVVIGQLSPLS